MALDKLKFSLMDIIFKYLYKNDDIEEEKLHESVLNENDFVMSKADDTNSHIIIKNIDKKYFSFSKKRNIYAVKDVYLSLRTNECLCLLGKNGAGKSTLFKMLVDAESQSSGNIIMHQRDVNSIFLSYCPQTDSLNENLTPYQILDHLCKIYGYSKESTVTIIQELINAVSIKKYTHIKINQLSAGNKRRLCAAICTIGNPKVILLDEPTAGVDPSARYLIWNLLYNIKKTGKSILFTSHNMRECEIYSERIALINQGNIKRVGTPENVKRSFNLGYELLISGDDNSIQLLKDNLKKEFINSEFENTSHGLRVMIPISYEKLLPLFKVLNDSKSQGLSFTYQINQAKMENVFFDR